MAEARRPHIGEREGNPKSATASRATISSVVVPAGHHAAPLPLTTVRRSPPSPPPSSPPRAAGCTPPWPKKASSRRSSWQDGTCVAVSDSIGAVTAAGMETNEPATKVAGEQEEEPSSSGGGAEPEVSATPAIVVFSSSHMFTGEEKETIGERGILVS
uniref:Uncharacterized protein n=1 Tax=Oryza meridionalis TaxID=40149 RepID=A0A0E0E976_9ORYZ